MKNIIFKNKFLCAIVFGIVFISCNSTHKVVSSFGKRKYTKGYYFNFPAPHKNNSATAGVIHSPVKKNTESFGVSTPVNGSASSLQSLEITVTEKNTSIYTHAPVLYSGSTNIEFPDSARQNRHVQAGDPARTYSPVHPYAYSGTKYDQDARAGNVLGIISLIFLLLFPPVSIITGIIGLLFSISGLRSDKLHRTARRGVTMNLVAIILVIVFVLLFIYLLSFL